MVDYTDLRTSLYVPANHPKLSLGLFDEIMPEAPSYILCTEDSLADSELPLALRQISQLLPLLTRRRSTQVPTRAPHARNGTPRRSSNAQDAANPNETQTFSTLCFKLLCVPGGTMHVSFKLDLDVCRCMVLDAKLKAGPPQNM